MFKNYFKTAIRNLWRNKGFSAINIAGLALGLACSLLIFLWVQDERSKDRFHTNREQLYTLYEQQYSGGKIISQYFTPGIMADEIKRVVPEVQLAASARQNEPHTLQAGDKMLKASGGFASAAFLQLFSYPVLQGSAARALNTPADIVLNKDMAVSLFGSTQAAMGKTVRFDDKKDFRVTAVVEVPAASSVQFAYLVNWFSFLDDHPSMKEWGNHGVDSYVLLKKGADPVAFAAKMKTFLAPHSDFNAAFRIDLGVQRYDDTYLHSHFNSQGQAEGGRIQYVQLFSVVALFILLIACINFMNLTTARSVKRAREIGVRKVVGALRISLIAQFIGEALLLAAVSVILALGIVGLVLPAFNTLTQKQMDIPLHNIPFWVMVLVVTLVTGVVSGSYPALFLSSLKPVRVLKGTLKQGSFSALFRKGLVVFQFVLSIVLIIGTIVVSRQVQYIQSSNLGYNRENLVYIPQEGALNTRYQLFKTEALKLPGITAVSVTEEAPTNITTSTWGIDWEGKDPNVQPTFNYAGVGYDFARTMGIEVLAGRDFSPSFATDSTGYILNEEAAKEVGYKNPVGKSFTMWGRKATIIGVVKNFHFNSMHVAVNPMVLWLGEKMRNGNVLVKIQAGKTKEALDGLQHLCKTINPAFPFSYQFSEEAFQRLYASEQLVNRLSNYFAVLAIFISCLGLLGLAMFTAEQRTREIGIRKVLGANTASLFALLSKEFFALVVIALLVASPLAWFCMNRWLQDFSYRTHISWWMFAIAGVAAILITLATISFQTIKAALANPVKSLRAE